MFRTQHPLEKAYANYVRTLAQVSIGMTNVFLQWPQFVAHKYQQAAPKSSKPYPVSDYRPEL